MILYKVQGAPCRGAKADLRPMQERIGVLEFGSIQKSAVLQKCYRKTDVVQCWFLRKIYKKEGFLWQL